jgi:Cu/Ag efflux protein CusF
VVKVCRTAVLAAALVLVPLVAAAQKSMGAVVSETFTIEAIDHSTRVVTLKDKNGKLDDVMCGPEVTRFDALKVGDKVTMRYYESLVSAIRTPGTPVKPAAEAGLTRTPGEKPGGTLSKQVTATVTIVAMDTKVPSVTVKTSDGRTVSFKVEDKKNLEGFKPGDTVDITYTQALAISVTPAK